MQHGRDREMSNTTARKPQKLKGKRSLTPGAIVAFARKIKMELLPILRDEGKLLNDYDIEDNYLQELLKNVEKNIDESIEKGQSPLRISMIGTFTSGKTSALCALLKRWFILPKLQRPTSGNVVEIQIVPPGQVPASSQIKCQLFSQLELEEMLRDYYAFLQKETDTRFKELPVQPGFLRELIGECCAEVRELLRQKWLKEHKNLMDPEALQRLAHLYVILITVRHYYERYHENCKIDKTYLFMLPYEPEHEASLNRLKVLAILEMDLASNQLHPDNLDKMVAELWKYTPDTFEQFCRACKDGIIKIQAIRALFPLYKRIILTEEMELNQGWGSDIEHISILDFPGLDSSNRRDMYLCLKELKVAHTNMLFILASRPTVQYAYPLIRLIAEAKTLYEVQSINIAERIIPIISFFEEYEHYLERVDDDNEEQQSAQQALRRVREFFCKQEIEGMRTHGFDQFDPVILSALQTMNDYHLLTPAVTVEPKNLNRVEQAASQRYHDNLSFYGQLLRDVKKAQRETEIKEERDKFRRLSLALEAYTQSRDGGVGYLREKIGDTLKSKGSKLIAEDACIPLLQAVERIERDVIDKLLEADVDVENVRENIAADEALRKIHDLWNEMRELTREWTRQKHHVSLVYKREERLSKKVSYISPIKLCAAKARELVIGDQFWNPLNPVTPPKDVSLAQLKTRWEENIMQELEAWGDNLLQETIMHSLEYLDETELPLETGGSVSFQGLSDELFENYVNYTSLEKKDRKILKDLFSVSSEAVVLRDLLKEKWTKEMEQQRRIYGSLPNTKVPFNESLLFSWSPFEIMKIQRQMILTLQRKLTDRFACYSSAFFHEVSQILEDRLNEASDTGIQGWFKHFNQMPGGVFAQLATVSEEEKEDNPETLSIYQRKQKAKETVSKILNIWNEL